MHVPIKVTDELVLTIGDSRVKLNATQTLRLAEDLIRKGARGLVLESQNAARTPLAYNKRGAK